MQKYPGFTDAGDIQVRDTPEGNRWPYSLDELCERLGKLHSCPGIAWRILQLLKDTDYDIHEIQSLLQTDPALSAAILRLVNSSAFGLARSVTSLRQAITFLGARSLRLALLSFGLVKRLTRGTPAQVFEDFWRRALTTAVVAQKIYTAKRYGNAEEAYCAGLLAEIGVLIFCQLDTKRYLSLYLQHDHGHGLISAERECYGYEHSVLGARLLQIWGLPDPLTAAVQLHHEPAACDTPLLRAVCAGAMCGEVLWVPNSPLLGVLRKWLEEHFSWDLDRFIDLVNETKRDVLDSAQLFSVRLKGRIDVERLRKESLQMFRDAALETALEYDSVSAVLRDQFAG